MKSKYFHIALSLLLTIAVSDYIWIELFEDQQIVAELEIEKEKELEEEFKEKGASNDHYVLINFDWFETSYSHVVQALSTNSFFKHGNSFCPLINNVPPKLFLLFSQLRLDC